MSSIRTNTLPRQQSTSRATTSRDAALSAAVAVILRDGILGMTIEAVAREAGLSKGGVLYHFSSKDALLRGMLEHFLEAMEADMEASRAADPIEVGRWMRGYLKTFFAGTAGVAANLPASQQRNLHAAMFAAIVINRDLLIPVVQRYGDRWRIASQNDGVPASEQLITWLAADGLWVWEILGIIPGDGTEKAQIVESLIQRTLPSSPPSDTKLTSGQEPQST